jgi:superfamily I DNA/RNA helicase
MANTWSNEQEDIYRWFAQPDGSNLVVEAYAGTGKSTTIAEGVNRAPEQSIIVSSFMSSAVEDLKQKITNPNVEVVSLHGVGNRTVKRYWERIGLDKSGKRAWNLAEAVCGQSAPDAIKRLVSKLCTKAREITPFATAADELVEVALQFDCVPDDEWKTDGYDLLKVCDLAVATLDLAAREKPTATGIDFADMLFLPLRNKWLRPTFDLGVVDETQDMTFTQLALFQGVVRGRIAIVGDRRQAIFAFRGADSGSMDRLTAELKPRELKLSTTYRCGKAIVAAAQRFVPDYKAYEGNGQGLVNAIPQAQIYDQLAPGNWVLSRTNAPLVSIALGLVRRGRRVRIQGRDIGAGLKAVVNKCATGPARNSVPKWLERLAAWKERETKRAAAQKSDALVEKILDQYETLLALVDGVAGIPELLTRLDGLFDDKDANGVPQIVCSSVHKAKGREADRVFLLDWTFGLAPGCVDCRKRPNNCKCPGGYKPDPIAQQEERNIEYVAITRARAELTRVSK